MTLQTHLLPGCWKHHTKVMLPLSSRMLPVIPLPVCLSSSDPVCPGSPSISLSLPLCICQMISEYVCVCTRACVHVSACLSLQVCVLPSLLLSPSFSVCVFFLSLSPSVLSLSPSSTVCLCTSIYDYHDCPVNQGCIMTFMGPALLPSWAPSCMKKKLQHIL